MLRGVGGRYLAAVMVVVVTVLSKRWWRCGVAKTRVLRLATPPHAGAIWPSAACWVGWAAAARKRQGQRVGQRASQFFLHARGCGGGNHQILSASAEGGERETHTPERTQSTHARRVSRLIPTEIENEFLEGSRHSHTLPPVTARGWAVEKERELGDTLPRTSTRSSRTANDTRLLKMS